MARIGWYIFYCDTCGFGRIANPLRIRLQKLAKLVQQLDAFVITGYYQYAIPLVTEVGTVKFVVMTGFVIWGLARYSL